MNIDLLYDIENDGNDYTIYGPEYFQSNNIYVNSSGYTYTTEAQCVDKMDEMIESLAPYIINVTGTFVKTFPSMTVYCMRGELNTFSKPDYTQILTNINTNLSSISDKLKTSNDNKTVSGCLERIFNCLNNGSITESSANVRNNSYIRNTMYYEGNVGRDFGLSKVIDYNSNLILTVLRQLNSNLQQSVSPNSSITDVISSLNSNIHNDLTNINTTAENKDTILLIDGQQEFKLRNKEEMDF